MAAVSGSGIIDLDLFAQGQIADQIDNNTLVISLLADITVTEGEILEKIQKIKESKIDFAVKSKEEELITDLSQKITIKQNAGHLKVRKKIVKKISLLFKERVSIQFTLQENVITCTLQHALDTAEQGKIAEMVKLIKYLEFEILQVDEQESLQIERTKTPTSEKQGKCLTIYIKSIAIMALLVLIARLYFPAIKITLAQIYAAIKSRVS